MEQEIIEIKQADMLSAINRAEVDIQIATANRLLTSTFIFAFQVSRCKGNNFRRHSRKKQAHLAACHDRRVNQQVQRYVI